MKLTKEQIDEIVAACGGGDLMRAALTRVFGERVNPYEGWRGSGGPADLVPALFDAAAKVADGVDDDGLSRVGIQAPYRAALKRIVEEIRGMA